jgi:hypothetical protein
LRDMRNSSLRLLITTKVFFEELEEGNFTIDELERLIYPKFPLRKITFSILPILRMKFKKAFFQMQHNKAPGPGGFPAEFYQTFWDTIKSNLLQLFGDLHTRQLELFHLNFSDIILLRKVNKAERIQQYRPICLLSNSFKIFIMVATTRLNTVEDHVVHLT